MGRKCLHFEWTYLCSNCREPSRSYVLDQHDIHIERICLNCGTKFMHTTNFLNDPWPSKIPSDWYGYDGEAEWPSKIGTS